MTKHLRQRQTEVRLRAVRFDASFDAMVGQTQSLRGAARAISPPLLLGAGLAAGFLLVILPGRLRGPLFVSIGQFVIARLLQLWRPGGVA
ncbi:MAG: hypothetical protein ABI411_21070 [Tahibacter sp.]